MEACMRTVGAITTLSLLLLGATVLAAPEGWHKKLDDGVAAAKKSGKPVFVVTMWKEKV
jgi:hypothetical protein